MDDSVNSRKRTRERRERPKRYEVVDTDNKQPGFGGFTEQENTDLFQALKKYGVNNWEEIKKSVPTRSDHQLRNHLYHLKKKAQKSLLESATVKNGTVRVRRRDKVALDLWLDRLISSNQNSPVPAVGQALRFITEFEDHPDPALCGGVDFKLLYQYLETMMTGCPFQEISSVNSLFLLESLQKLSEQTDENDMGKEINFVITAQPRWRTRDPSRTYGQEGREKDKNAEILALPKLNPFGIPADWFEKSITFK